MFLFFVTQLLGCGHLVNRETNIEFIFSTEGQFTGGFAKWPNSHPGTYFVKREPGGRHLIVHLCRFHYY